MAELVDVPPGLAGVAVAETEMFNNSTFATRVVASSGADLVACVVAGFCSLSGPRHGADVERILDMYDAIGEPGQAEEWLRQEVAAGRRLHEVVGALQSQHVPAGPVASLQDTLADPQLSARKVPTWSRSHTQ